MSRPRPRQREPWGKRPNGPAKRYVRLFLYAILTIAVIGRVSVWLGGSETGNDAYYKSSADAYALRGRTLSVVEHVVQSTHPAGIGAAHTTHVHLPTGGYLVAWVAPRSKSEASRPAVWASRRDAIEELGDDSSHSETSKWSDPFVLARAPGTPGSHRSPALFFVNNMLRLHFSVRGGVGEVTAFETSSGDYGKTWSEVAEIKDRLTARTSTVPASCAVGGTLPRKHSIDGDDTHGELSCLGEVTVDSEMRNIIPVLVMREVKKEDPSEKFSVSGFAKAPVGLTTTSASLFRNPFVSKSGKHSASVVFVTGDGCLYRSDSVDGGVSWSKAERLDFDNLNLRAVPRGGVSTAAVGRKSVVMTSVFFDTKTKSTLVRVRISDNGGKSWPWLNGVPLPGGCFDDDDGDAINDSECGVPIVEPWPNQAEGFTVTFGLGSSGGIGFVASSITGFKATC